jgi:hypothetical protein
MDIKAEKFEAAIHRSLKVNDHRLFSLFKGPKARPRIGC